jgi:hypothetical protein
MSNYSIPTTAQERLQDFTNMYNEFCEQSATFKEKSKKASGHRARKALLNMTKLIRIIRKDIQADIEAIEAAKKAKN